MYKPRNHFICIDLQQKPSQRVKQALRFSSASAFLQSSGKPKLSNAMFLVDLQ